MTPLILSLAERVCTLSQLMGAAAERLSWDSERVQRLVAEAERVRELVGELERLVREGDTCERHTRNF